MTEIPLCMAGLRGVIMGVANERSIAWGIAQACHAAGARMIFTYQGEALRKRVLPLAERVGAADALICDASDAGSLDSVFSQVNEHWGGLDFVLHAIAFSDKEELKGRYVDTSESNFTQTMLVSCYSFTAVVRRASKLMNGGGSCLTLTYVGAERVMPHYNVMGVAKAALEASVRYLAMDLGRQGVRVNALSAGPMKTLAASGIGDFRYILKWNELNSALRRNVVQEEVGRAGMYLLSGLSSGVTGETHHVDCGYNIVGMKAADAPDISTV